MSRQLRGGLDSNRSRPKLGRLKRRKHLPDEDTSFKTHAVALQRP